MALILLVSNNGGWLWKFPFSGRGISSGTDPVEVYGNYLGNAGYMVFFGLFLGNRSGKEGEKEGRVGRDKKGGKGKEF